jgi:hypothetical protein
VLRSLPVELGVIVVDLAAKEGRKGGREGGRQGGREERRKGGREGERVLETSLCTKIPPLQFIPHPPSLPPSLPLILEAVGKCS